MADYAACASSCYTNGSCWQSSRTRRSHNTNATYGRSGYAFWLCSCYGIRKLYAVYFRAFCWYASAVGGISWSSTYMSFRHMRRHLGFRLDAKTFGSAAYICVCCLGRIANRNFAARLACNGIAKRINCNNRHTYCCFD